MVVRGIETKMEKEPELYALIAPGCAILQIWIVLRVGFCSFDCAVKSIG